MTNATHSPASEQAPCTLPSSGELPHKFTWNSLVAYEQRIELLRRQAKAVPRRHRTLERWQSIESRLNELAGPPIDRTCAVTRLSKQPGIDCMWRS